MKKLSTVSEMIDELDASLDHLTAAFDMAHANNMPNKEIELLAMKRHILGIRKELDMMYKAGLNSEIKRMVTDKIMPSVTK